MKFTMWSQQIGMQCLIFYFAQDMLRMIIVFELPSKGHPRRGYHTILFISHAPFFKKSATGIQDIHYKQGNMVIDISASGQKGK